MKKKLEVFKERIVKTLKDMEIDLIKTEKEWEQRKGVFKSKGYVYKENINVFNNELKSIKKTMEIIEEIDITGFKMIKDFKATMISKLEDLYDQSVLMRSGLNLIIRTIYKVDENALPDIIIE
ncbi:MAG: hypothetical protein GXP33_05430 [Spirochaetes bacterium]|nr:hypothetical protein [Spirochaetota bacterium]